MVSEAKPGPDRRDGALWMSVGRGSSRQHCLCKGPWATWYLAGGEGTLRPQGERCPPWGVRHVGAASWHLYTHLSLPAPHPGMEVGGLGAHLACGRAQEA